MSDKSYVFHQTGKQFASHQSAYHIVKEYARRNVHINKAESFNAMLETIKTGVSHFMSSKHLGLYLSGLSFRWYNRDPKEGATKIGKKKTIWKPNPIIEQLTSLLPFACVAKLRWQRTGAAIKIAFNNFLTKSAFFLRNRPVKELKAFFKKQNYVKGRYMK